MSYRLLFAILILALVVSLSGCQFAPPAASASGDPISRLDPSGSEVILWHSLSGAEANELADLADEFNAANPWHIVVVPQYQGTYPTLRNRLDDALDRGAAPDLVPLYPYHASDYVRQSAAVPVDPYTASVRFGLSEADRADIFPTFLSSDRNPQFGGQLTSFPMERSAVVLYYNADWLTSLGYQDPPLTWPAFKEMCDRATTNVTGDGAPDVFGYALVPDASTFAALVFSRGGVLTSDDDRQARFNSTEGVKAMNILRDVFSPKHAYIAPGRGSDMADFAQMKTLFTIGLSRDLPAYAAAVNRGLLFRWGVAPLPHNNPDPVADFVGASWTVFKTTPQRQLAAWLFIRWFTGVQQTQRWAEATSTVPLRASAARAIKQEPTLDPQVKTVLDLLPYGQSEPVVTGWEPARQVLADTMQAVAQGQAPATALEQAEAKVTPLLK